MNAQVPRGFRLGGINDPLNVPLCTQQDLATFGGRESWTFDRERGTRARIGYLTNQPRTFGVSTRFHF